MIVAFEKSNPGYQWNWDEKSLVGRKVVIVFREEEYLDASTEMRTTVKPDEFHSIEALEQGRLKVKPKKELSEEDKRRFIDAHRSQDTTIENDADLPF